MTSSSCSDITKSGQNGVDNNIDKRETLRRRVYKRQKSLGFNNFRGMKKDELQKQTNITLASMTVRYSFKLNI